MGLGTEEYQKLIDQIDNFSRAIEEITKGFITTGSDHSAIHKGLGFTMCLEFATLAPLAKKVYRFTGPTTLFAHIKSIQLSVAGATCKGRLIKDVTITSPGTEIENVIQNLNANSDRTPQSKIYDGGTVEYTGGVRWCGVTAHADTAGVGGNLSRSSGQFIQNDYLEYVTEDGNVEYILEIENMSSSDTAIDLDLHVFFYEEPNGLIVINNS